MYPTTFTFEQVQITYRSFKITVTDLMKKQRFEVVHQTSSSVLFTLARAKTEGLRFQLN